MLSKEQLQALTLVKDKQNVFISGGAGTGKSFLLNYMKDLYDGANFHVTASTGIAAVHVGGRTLHSWAGLGMGDRGAEEVIKFLTSGKGTHMRRKLQKAKMLAVDEISMVPGYIFDDLNQILKVIRNNDKPFGGLQLILFGDFFQLPPVSMNADNELDFCFMSQAWQEAELRICDMKQVFRQHDAAFIDMLNRIRVGEPSALDTDMLLSRMITPEYQIDRPKPTFLATHHHYARSINETELSKLGGKIREYVMQDSGDKTSCEFLRKNCLASEILLLKEGTQVMMLKNTYHKDGIINGSTGIIDSFDASTNYPIVKFHNGKRMVIGPAEWAIEDLDPVTMKRRVKGAVKQVPLQLAWAITIHKSQGMTINKIECIMSNAFVEGQIYVALSRVRNLEDIFMHSFDASKIRAHPQVREFYKNRESVGVE